VSASSSTAPTPLEQQLADEIADAADLLAIAVPDLAGGLGKSFEAWLLLSIAVGLSETFDVVPIDYMGEATDSLVIRGAPGYIAKAAGAPGDKAGAIRIDHQGWQTVELHSSLRHSGVSTASHELDISLNLAYLCDSIRKKATAPYPGPPLLGLELKQYGAHLTLNKNFGRALLAVAVDLQPQWLFDEILLRRRQTLMGTWTAQRGAEYRLVTTAGLTSETSKLLDAYGIGADAHFEPGSSPALTGIIDQAASAIRTSWPWFR